MNSLLSKSILVMDQFIVERVNINQSNVPSRRVWLFTLSPDKQSLLLFSNQPIQLKTRSACVLVAGTQRNFSKSLVKVGYSSLGLPQTKGVLVLVHRRLIFEPVR